MPNRIPAESNAAPIDRDAHVAAGVSMGRNVVIHPGTRIGANVVIQDNAVLGKPVALGPLSTASDSPQQPAMIATGARVLCGAIVFAGATLESGAVAGDQSQIRERSRIGPGSTVGRGSAIDNDVWVGRRVRIQTNCYLTANSRVEDDVFVGPGVVTTNDDTMARHERGARRAGVILRRACRIGGGAVLCPGIEIGPEAFVAAGAVVCADVPARAVVMGVPARHVRDVGDEDLIERWR